MDERLKKLLAEGAKALTPGLNLEQEALELLAIYFDLLDTWNQKMNLTGIRGHEERINRLFLDSLVPAVMVKGPGPAADLGSGAGFPGLVAAIVRPDVEVWLVDSRAKRCDFLRHAVRELGLSNVEVRRSRVEELDERFDAAFAKGVAGLMELAGMGSMVLKGGGALYAMKGAGAKDELAGLEAELREKGFALEDAVDYELPGGIKRSVVVLKRL